MKTSLKSHAATQRIINANKVIDLPLIFRVPIRSSSQNSSMDKKFLKLSMIERGMSWVKLVVIRISQIL